MSRITAKFAALKKENRAAFVPFITAGDPNYDTALALMTKLPSIGADVIELGIPFSDPMADGPVNQASYLRALEAGMNLHKVLRMVETFRKTDKTTPVVLMGSYNPIHAYGTARLVKDAAGAGVDGFLIVDLPPEEDEVLRLPCNLHGLDVVRFVTPTSDDARIETILNGASGYLYYISFTGTTGTQAIGHSEVAANIARLKTHTNLPCTVGFGIRTPEQAAETAQVAEGVVVGSAIVNRIFENHRDGRNSSELVANVLEFCSGLAKSVHAARTATVVE
ncbi:MAG TPA: tryptophan synthase subunit alpha [Rhizomicrobium sp.]|jgi:tryptophan synthase alpha chain|nr:tryptophan synthase subunit alpha [Rhizomicrobium sp.]